jgi:hypothetical protein
MLSSWVGTGWYVVSHIQITVSSGVSPIQGPSQVRAVLLSLWLFF